MAKDKSKSGKKKDDKDASRDAVEAVRSAFERTLAATAGGAQETRERAQGLLDEIAAAAARVRHAIDEVNLLDELRGLRGDLETLARRVSVLERRSPGEEAPAAAGETASQTPAAVKPAARRGAAKASSKAAKGKRAAKGTRAAKGAAPSGAAGAKGAGRTAKGGSSPGTATAKGAAKRAKRGAGKRAPATETADDAGSGRS